MNIKHQGIKSSTQQSNYLRMNGIPTSLQNSPRKGGSIPQQKKNSHESSPLFQGLIKDREQKNQNDSSPHFQGVKQEFSQKLYFPKPYKTVLPRQQTPKQPFKPSEKDKMDFILSKMQNLQDKLSSVQKYVDQGKKQEKKQLQHTLIRVKSTAQMCSAFNNKTDQSVVSGVSTQRIDAELDGIQSRIKILNKRKDYLLQNHENLDILIRERISSILPSQDLPSKQIFNIDTGRSNYISQPQNSNQVTMWTPKVFSPALSQVNLFELQTMENKKTQFDTTRDQFGNQIYEGAMINGQFEGKGRLQNTKYSNKIKQDFIDSLGELCITQSSSFWTSYEGSFKQNKFDGLGNLYVGDKYKLNGQFIHGKANGRITIIDKQKNCIAMMGIFKDGFIDKIILQKNH